MSGGSSRRYPSELRERAVRMVLEVRDQHDSEWAAIRAVSGLLGVGYRDGAQVSAPAEIDTGSRSGIRTEESVELKRLRRESAELKVPTPF